jgi:hypothetical protein
MDSDGYGDPAVTLEDCDQPTGYIANYSDCDDGDWSVNPGATEVCDADDVDEDCDGLSDDADSSVTGTSTYYIDSDGDSYGDASAPVDVCDPTASQVVNSTDCDDTNALVHPGAVEVCDSSDTDDDCDGLADDADSSVDAGTYVTFYIDSDGDGYGDVSSTTQQCDVPSGYSRNASDCNDGDATISPAATEVCDSADVDEDCDGLSDDADSSVDSSTHNTFYADTDADGYGDPSSTMGACDQPSGFALNGADCDDADSGVNPGATEVCDSADLDEDCNGFADDADSGVDTSTYLTWYADMDSDGYGDLSSTTGACDVPSGYVADSTDCDDSNVDINPIATEVCDADDTDEDCDGFADDSDSSVDVTSMTDWYPDSDSDGFGDSTASATTQCDAPSGYVDNATDCDDADASSTTNEWYADSDGDSFGDPTSTLSTCSPPSGYVSDDQDCDDTDSSVNPDSVELSFDLATGTEIDNCDGMDSDCDGIVDEGCSDNDGDGVDDGAQLMFACDLDGDGYANSLCMPQAFSGSWLGSDCMYTFSPFNSSITLAAAKTPVSGVEFGGNTYDDVCYINGGGSPGTFYITAVSDIGSDGSSTVDITDSTDWVHADLSWCSYYSSSICYNAGGSVVDYAFQATWDGTEFSY